MQIVVHRSAILRCIRPRSSRGIRVAHPYCPTTGRRASLCATFPWIASSSVEASVRTMASIPSANDAPTNDPLVQYVALRKDIVIDWPVGAVAAQAAHAATAALWLSRDSETTTQYCCGDNINHMRKVVLEASDETQLLEIAAKLEEAGIKHKLWIEQPENVPTALAAAPNHKSLVGPFFKKLKLCGSSSSKQN